MQREAFEQYSHKKLQRCPSNTTDTHHPSRFMTLFSFTLIFDMYRSKWDLNRNVFRVLFTAEYFSTQHGSIKNVFKLESKWDTLNKGRDTSHEKVSSASGPSKWHRDWSKQSAVPTPVREPLTIKCFCVCFRFYLNSSPKMDLDGLLYVCFVRWLRSTNGEGLGWSDKRSSAQPTNKPTNQPTSTSAAAKSE